MFEVNKMKEEKEKFRKEFEDRLVKMGFHFNQAKDRKDWLSIEYMIKNENHLIDVFIYKDKNDNKEWANLVFFQPEQKFYNNITIDEMFKILEEWHK